MFTRSIRVFPRELFFTALTKLKKFSCQLGRLLKVIQTLTHSVSFQTALGPRVLHSNHFTSIKYETSRLILPSHIVKASQ